MQAVFARIGTPRKAVRTTISFSVLLVLFVLLWEGYKTIGKALGGEIPFTSIRLPVSPYDAGMPHTWDIAATFFNPATRGTTETVLSVQLQAALFTWREVVLGFAIGSVVGFGLAVLFVMSRPVERGLMPYVVASQTIPLLALAPMVVIWGSKVGLPAWGSVSIIAAYLSFFPVTINTVRGLRSPPDTATELMRSYGASRRQTLLKLQIPAAMPFVFTALKVAATASVIGAIIGELPASMNAGLGRSILTGSFYFGTSPERLFTAIIIAALLGVVSVALVALAERVFLPPTRRVEG